MSQIYTLEPPCDGKVVFHTSFGDIDIELWPREAPLACRNFVQLCLDGYYDNTIFHRIIAKFMIQGGDPTGVGDGGQSASGIPFKDEFHSRLKFNHRGILAMANANEADANASQFFLTLDSCEWLNKKHTIFGKVVGQTMFNLLRMGDAEVGANDRPVDPPRLERVSVLTNPFDDIVPRLIAGSEASKLVETEASKRKKARKKVNDRSLLSFGDEEDVAAPSAMVPGQGLSAAAAPGGARAAASGAPVSARAAAPLTEEEKAAALRSAVSGKRAHGEDGGGDRFLGVGGGEDEDYLELQARMKAQQKGRMEKMRGASTAKPLSTPRGDDAAGAESLRDLAGDGDQSAKAAAAAAAAATRAEYDATVKAMKAVSASRQAAKVLAHAAEAEGGSQVGLMSELERQRAKFLGRKRDADLGARQHDTMAALLSFSSKLTTIKKGVKAAAAGAKDDEVAVEGLGGRDSDKEDHQGYHGQVTEGDQLFGKDSDDEGGSWFGGPLKFKKHASDDASRKGPTVGDYMVLDSRTHDLDAIDDAKRSRNAAKLLRDDDANRGGRGGHRGEGNRGEERDDRGGEEGRRRAYRGGDWPGDRGGAGGERRRSDRSRSRDRGSRRDHSRDRTRDRTRDRSRERNRSKSRSHDRSKDHSKPAASNHDDYL